MPIATRIWVVLPVEAQVSPQDVAFLHTGLPATVKISVYDYSIYGGLDGKVEHISADTISEEKRTESVFSESEWVHKMPYIDGPQGRLPIIPGMVASVEILTGHKSVLDYLLKPVLKTREVALRER